MEPSRTVSIVTATRNRAGTAAEALGSLAAQRFRDFESILVDDGSDPEQAAAYQSLVGRMDDRFHLLQPLRPGEIGSGPAIARNRGIKAAKGRFLAFLDDDDTWTCAEHLGVAVNALERFDADIFCADMQGFRGDQLVLPTWFTAPERLEACPRVQDEPRVHRLTRGVFVESALTRVIHPNMLVIRRDLIVRAGEFLPSLRFAEDTEFVLRLADNTDRILFSPIAIARYRLPEGNAHSLTVDSTQQDLQTLAAAQALKMRSKTPEVRHAADVIESWTMRRLSDDLRDEGRKGAALRAALQGLVAHPTVGALAHVLRVSVARTGSR